MTEPSEWTCDTCRKAITEPRKALLVWHVEDDLTLSRFRIVHKGACDPDRSDHSMELGDMLGQDGLAWMLAFLSPGPLHHPRNSPRIRDFDEFVDVLRRLQVPHYEQARQYWHVPEVGDRWSDANEVYPYTPDQLAQIVEVGEAHTD